MMKNLKSILAFALIAFTIAACTKPEDGATGPQGPAGVNGNANVMQITHGRDTIGSSLIISVDLPVSVTQAVIDSSLVLVYYETNGYTFPSPGMGFNGAYQTRWRKIESQQTIDLNLWNVDGTLYTGGDEVFDETRVIIAPASSFFAGKKEAVDFSNYQEVKRYFNLKD